MSTEVREYAFKFLQMLLFLSEDFRASFAEQGGYDTLSDFTILRGSAARSKDDIRDDRGEKRSTLLHVGELEAMEA